MRVKQGLQTADETESDRSEYVDRRSEIREKASAIFLRHGYRKTTIEDIGNACGLGKAALYHYYASKEEIFAEVVRVECMTVTAKIRAAVAIADDPRAKLMAAVKTSFSQARARLDELVDRKFASDAADWLPLIGKPLRQFVDTQVLIIHEILQEGERQGVFRKVTSPTFAAEINFGMQGALYGLLGVQITSMEQPYVLPTEETIDTLLGVFMDGLCLK